MTRYAVHKEALRGLHAHASINREVQALAEQILEEAKARTPVETGELRASGFVDGENSAYTVGFNEEYAPYVELGTDDTTAQPFLAPAALQVRGPL